jgi:hypothetical protein
LVRESSVQLLAISFVIHLDRYNDWRFFEQQKMGNWNGKERQCKVLLFNDKKKTAGQRRAALHCVGTAIARLLICPCGAFGMVGATPQFW